MLFNVDKLRSIIHDPKANVKYFVMAAPHKDDKEITESDMHIFSMGIELFGKQFAKSSILARYFVLQDYDIPNIYPIEKQGDHQLFFTTSDFYMQLNPDRHLCLFAFSAYNNVIYPMSFMSMEYDHAHEIMNIKPIPYSAEEFDDSEISTPIKTLMEKSLFNIQKGNKDE